MSARLASVYRQRLFTINNYNLLFNAVKIAPSSYQNGLNYQTHREKRLVSISSASRTAAAPQSSSFEAPPAVTSNIVPLNEVPPVAKTVLAEAPSSSATALSALPLSSVLRSYAIMSMSASPRILDISMWGIRKMLSARSALFDPERNAVLRWLLKHTFYAQFCAGENVTEVRDCIKDLEKIGYQGIVLEYASEVLTDGSPTAPKIQADIDEWRDGCLQSIAMARSGDLVAMKWSGMGSEALRLLKENAPPSAPMAQAMTDICEAAAAKGVALLPAAEPQNANPAVDQWTLDLAARYNRNPDGHAIVFNTYQCYLKSTPQTLARHLAHAAQNNYTLGVKLVRGAYLETEVRNLIWDTIEETHHAYDDLAQQCIEKQWGGLLQPAAQTHASPFPDVNVMLATHNLASVKKGIQLREEQVITGKPLTRMCFAQLQGMADEVSCELLEDQRHLLEVKGVAPANLPKVFKYVTWGTTGQCLHYLSRRAEENKDAIGRTRATSQAMGRELARRARALLGL